MTKVCFANSSHMGSLISNDLIKSQIYIKKTKIATDFRFFLLFIINFLLTGGVFASKSTMKGLKQRMR